MRIAPPAVNHRSVAASLLYIGICQLDFSLGVPCPTSSIVKSRNEYNFLLLASKIPLHLANDCVAKVVQHCLRNSVHYGVYPRPVFDKKHPWIGGSQNPRDLSGYAREVVRCRCTSDFVYVGRKLAELTPKVNWCISADNIRVLWKSLRPRGGRKTRILLL